MLYNKICFFLILDIKMSLNRNNPFVYNMRDPRRINY